MCAVIASSACIALGYCEVKQLGGLLYLKIASDAMLERLKFKHILGEGGGGACALHAHVPLPCTVLFTVTLPNQCE